MKRLFRVLDTYFESKAEAKAFRNGTKGAVVHRGPDHWRGETDGTVHNMPKQGERPGDRL